jgi:hypothetical protein
MVRRPRRSLPLVLATLLGLVAPIVGPAPVASAADGAIGYAMVYCELHTLDLETGELTDLPAFASPATCAADLAVAPNGTVWGLVDIPVPTSPLRAGFVVRFNAEGEGFTHEITVEGATEASLVTGGLAIEPDGTIYIQLSTDGPGCSLTEVCLYRYDLDTTIASPVGVSGETSTPLEHLASCSSGLRSMAGGQLLAVDDATGAASPLVTIDARLLGYDCLRDSDVLHAVAGPADEVLSPQDVTVGTVDPATGAYTAQAVLSDPEAAVNALAVGPAPASTTTTTTTTPATTPPAAAPGAVVTPTFTG